MRNIFLAFLLLSYFTGAGQKKHVVVDYELSKPPVLIGRGLYLAHAGGVFKALQINRAPVSRLFARAGWWNAANILEAMVDYGRLTGYDMRQTCRQIYNANHLKMLGGFRNWAFDDSGWWALAWLKAYDEYKCPEYFKTAENIFAFMLNRGWDDRCGGGMNWMRNHPYKNAVTNELFILLSARLAERETDTARKAYYLNWSVKAYRWLNQRGMLNANHLYNDGLDTNCKNNGGNTWTYNQGVILAAEKELFVLTGDKAYLESAHATALACMHHVADKDSVLTDRLGKTAGPDCPQFKGIYIRHLAELNTVLKDPAIRQFILHNADVAWSKGQDAGHRFDFKWQGPYTDWSGCATGAALDLMNAAVVVY